MELKRIIYRVDGVYTKIEGCNPTKNDYLTSLYQNDGVEAVDRELLFDINRGVLTVNPDNAELRNYYLTVEQFQKNTKSVILDNTKEKELLGEYYKKTLSKSLDEKFGGVRLIDANLFISMFDRFKSTYEVIAGKYPEASFFMEDNIKFCNKIVKEINKIPTVLDPIGVTKNKHEVYENQYTDDAKYNCENISEALTNISLKVKNNVLRRQAEKDVILWWIMSDKKLLPNDFELIDKLGHLDYAMKIIGEPLKEAPPLINNSMSTKFIKENQEQDLEFIDYDI